MLTQVAEAHGWKFTVYYLLASSTGASVLPRVLSAPLVFDCVRPRLSFCPPLSRSTFSHMNVLSFIIRSRPRLICGVLVLGHSAQPHILQSGNSTEHVREFHSPHFPNQVRAATSSRERAKRLPRQHGGWKSRLWFPLGQVATTTLTGLRRSQPYKSKCPFPYLRHTDRCTAKTTISTPVPRVTHFVCFMDARGTGPEAWVLDKEVPPLSFAPGSQLFGDRSGLGAFVLDTWSTARRKCVQPLALPKDAPQPVSGFLPNTAASHGDLTDTAGTVMYWRFAHGTARVMDKAASCGLPWRLAEGGFQEFIVEKVSDETARVTYAMVESTNLHPEGQSIRDFKRMPWLAYKLHVLYGQFLLYKTLNRLRKS